MTNIFNVVGEHRHETDVLLLLGADGRYYAYATDDADPTEVEPSEDWLIDIEATEQALEL